MRNGDRTASERLARRYHADLYAYFCSRLGREDAADLTQLTLLHTVAKLERFRSESSFRHYVYAVARKVFSEKSRRTQRRLDTEDPTSSEPPASQTTPSERVFRAEYKAQLDTAIASLDDHYRQVVSLHLRGADNFEIAETLELHYNTVRSRLSRGLAAIRARLSPLLFERRRSRSLPKRQV
jgi:RNA polymerase sigma-70 factor, ECF subfamily